MTLIQALKTYSYTDLALDILGVTEEEYQSIEDPGDFVIRYLRLLTLQSLSECEEIMNLQNEVNACLPRHG